MVKPIPIDEIGSDEEEGRSMAMSSAPAEFKSSIPPDDTHSALDSSAAAASAAAAAATAATELTSLQSRRASVYNRLEELGGLQPVSLSGGHALERNNAVSQSLHWDYVLKEMVSSVYGLIGWWLNIVIFKAWLANDFGKERQRHVNNAKKVSKAVDTFHKTKETKKLRKVKVLIQYMLHGHILYGESFYARMKWFL
jgi:hypothetical protein